MHAAEYWLLLLFLGGLAIAAFWFIWNRWHRARLIDDVPTAKIRSAAQGYTELHGQALMADGYVTASPLTGSHCLWYRFKIEKRSRDLRGRRRWRTLHSGHSDTPFVMADDSGRCLIDPQDAEVTTAHKRIWYGTSEWPNAKSQRSKPATLLGLSLGVAHRYRYTEELLQEGDVYALGWFRTVSSAHQSVDTRVRELLRRWKSDPETLTARFDRDGDGSVDVREWEQAREVALHEVLQQQVSRQASTPIHTLRAPKDKTLPFLLSDHAPDNLVYRYRRQAAASLVVFMASSLTVLWMLSQRA